MSGTLRMALAGNPNSGKTTLFNALTGARQQVGNYPGVTVEQKEGVCRRGGAEIRVVDLPGTYSLTAYSQEERVARNYIIEEKPDLVVDVVDASNLERNLYLAVQLMELGVPVVLAFNMSDVAKARGLEFDLAEMSRLLRMPIVPTEGHRGKGLDELVAAAHQAAASAAGYRPAEIHYGADVEQVLAQITARLEGNCPAPGRASAAGRR